MAQAPTLRLALCCLQKGSREAGRSRLDGLPPRESVAESSGFRAKMPPVAQAVGHGALLLVG